MVQATALLNTFIIISIVATMFSFLPIILDILKESMVNVIGIVCTLLIIGIVTWIVQWLYVRRTYHEEDKKRVKKETEELLHSSILSYFMS